MNNDNTLSAKLTRIETAVGRIRTKTDTSTDTIENVATAVEAMTTPTGNINITSTSSVDVTDYATAQVVDSNLTAGNIKKDVTILGITGTHEGGTKSNIYKVSSIAERDLIDDMVEGDMCVVISGGDAGIVADTAFQVVKFPNSVTLDTAITSSGNSRDTSYDLNISWSASMFRCMYWGETSISINYTSSDGLTYTRTDSVGNPVDFGTELTITSAMFNSILSNFMLITSINFDVYSYTNNAWSYTDIGSSINASDLLLNKKAYSNTGMITGTRDMNKYREDFIKIQSSEPTDKTGLWIKLKSNVANVNYNSSTKKYTIPGSLHENSVIDISDIAFDVANRTPYTHTSGGSLGGGLWSMAQDGCRHCDIYYKHNDNLTYTCEGIMLGNYIYTFPGDGYKENNNNNIRCERIDLTDWTVTSLADFPVNNKILFCSPVYDGNGNFLIVSPVYRTYSSSSNVYPYKIYKYSIANNSWSQTSLSSSNYLDYSPYAYMDGYVYFTFASSTSKTVLAKINLSTLAVSNSDITKSSSTQVFYQNYIDGGDGYFYSSSGVKVNKSTLTKDTTAKTYGYNLPYLNYETLSDGDSIVFYGYEQGYNYFKSTISKTTGFKTLETFKIDFSPVTGYRTCSMLGYRLGDYDYFLGGYDPDTGLATRKGYKIKYSDIDMSKIFRPTITPTQQYLDSSLFLYCGGNNTQVQISNKDYLLLSDVYYGSTNGVENNNIESVYIGDGTSWTLFRSYQ